MQRLLGPVFTEGVLVPGIMAIGKALTEPEVSKFVTVGLLAEVEILFSSISNSSFAYLAEKKLLPGYKCVDALQWWIPSSGLASHNT